MILDINPALKADHFPSAIQDNECGNAIDSEPLFQVLNSLFISVGNSTERHVLIVSLEGLFVSVQRAKNYFDLFVHLILVIH